ncbi:MAG: hypothetical protein ABI707_13875 [Ferruginibacter sp.]
MTIEDAGFVYGASTGFTCGYSHSTPSGFLWTCIRSVRSYQLNDIAQGRFGINIKYPPNY